MRSDEREVELEDEDHSHKRIRVRSLSHLLNQKQCSATPASGLDPLGKILNVPDLEHSDFLGQLHSTIHHGLPPALLSSTTVPLTEASRELDSSIKNAYKEWKVAGGKTQGRVDQSAEWSCYCPHPGEQRQGDGEAAVMLLSGADVNRSIWSPLLPLLKAQRVATLQCAELGGGEPSKDLARAEAEAVTLAACSGHNKPLHLVALGGAALPALRLGAKRPDLVKRVVLVYPSLVDHSRPATADVPVTENPIIPANREVTSRETPGSVMDLLQRISQPTLVLSTDQDLSFKTALTMASNMDDCLYFDLGTKGFPLEDSEPGTFANIVTDFLHEESDASPFPFMRKGI